MIGRIKAAHNLVGMMIFMKFQSVHMIFDQLMKLYQFVLCTHPLCLNLGCIYLCFAAAQGEVILFFKILMLEPDVIPAEACSSQGNKIVLFCARYNVALLQGWIEVFILLDDLFGQRISKLVIAGEPRLQIFNVFGIRDLVE